MGSRADKRELRDHIAANVLEDIRAEFEQDQLNAISEETVQPHCEHEPNLLEFIRTIEFPDFQMDIYECTECGEEVQDIKPNRIED